MSQNLETAFKESLQKADAPYNPQAWEALQSRLDAAMPVATHKSPFTFSKVSAVAIVLVGISASLYYFVSSSPEEITTAKTKIKQENPTKEEVSTSNETAIAELDRAENDKPKTTLNANTQSLEKIKTTDHALVVATATTKLPQEFVDNLKTNGAKTIKNNEIPPKPANNTLISAPILLPAIAKQCVNDIVQINNSNSQNLVLVAPNGRRQIIASNKISSVQLLESGTYRLMDENERNETSFVVSGPGEPIFDIDTENIYKNGVPSTLVKANSIATNYKWTSNKSKTAGTGKEHEFHFFNRGEYTITLEIADNNGCKNATSKSLRVETDYNLMAVDAFSPSSDDPRKNTFMPFALKERNTAFTLTILDPVTGSVVYATKNATEGWDGSDRRNGNQASAGANYVWKVVLSNPLPGEADSYKGILIVVK